MKIKSFFESIKSKKLADIFSEFKMPNMSVKTDPVKAEFVKGSATELGQLAANLGVIAVGSSLASKLIGGVLRGAFTLLSGTLSIAGAGLKTFSFLLSSVFSAVKFGAIAFGWLC